MRGQAYHHLGDFERAQNDYEQAVQLARTTGDRQEEWQSLMELVNLMIGYDYQTLGGFFDDLLNLAISLGDPQKYALSRNIQAHWLDYIGQPDVGIPMHEEALAVFQQQGDRSGEARAFEFLGQAAAFYEDIQRAISYYDRAITLSRATGDKQTLIHTQPGLPRRENTGNMPTKPWRSTSPG